jgi:hypothetical protein
MYLTTKTNKQGELAATVEQERKVDSGDLEEQNSHLCSAKTRRQSHATRDITANTFAQRAADHMARHTCQYLSICCVATVVISVIGLIVGDFKVAVDNGGWYSRGTLISNRGTQLLLVRKFQEQLSSGDETTWENVTGNVQGMWGTLFTPRRRLTGEKNHPVLHLEQRRIAQKIDAQTNVTELGLAVPALTGCQAEYYYGPSMIWTEHLWPVWQVQKKGVSALDENVLRDICLAEQNTQQVLVEMEACSGNCAIGTGGCLPPFSLVLFARLQIGDVYFTKSCEEVARDFQEQRAQLEPQLLRCVADMRKSSSYNTYSLGEEQYLPESCPVGFSPFFVDDLFGTAQNGNLTTAIKYTSSVFITDNNEKNVEALYEAVNKYDRSTGEFVIGAYDTQYEAFANIFLDDSLPVDLTMAVGSAVITTIAILVHTRSPWLMVAGLLQVVLSFPVAYFVYSILWRLTFLYVSLCFLSQFVNRHTNFPPHVC